MVQVSVIGATGYAGIELVRILASHPEVTLTHLVSHSFAGQPLADIYPGFAGVTTQMLGEMDPAAIAKDSDIVFTSLPHGNDHIIAALFEQGKKIIDLSGDYRYNDPAVYALWYNTPHQNPALLARSVYGMPELHKESILQASLIGNPGCYTTCSILALAPLAKAGLIDTNTIVIDAKSGATGAGRGLTLDTHYCELNESAKAYKVASHRHTSEIEQELSLLAGKEVLLSFTPHLMPFNRGILATSYAHLAKGVSHADLEALYKDFYNGAPFVRIYKEGRLPELKFVRGTNFADIGFVIDKRLSRVVVVSAIDNLIKGAAGQAVQNMNLLCGLPETCGLIAPSWCI